MALIALFMAFRAAVNNWLIAKLGLVPKDES